MLSAVRPALALEARVREVHAAEGNVTVTVDLSDLVPEPLEHVIADGGTLHLRVEAQLWEARPVWDRLVYPALVAVWQIVGSGSADGVTLSGSTGPPATVSRGSAFTTTLRLGGADRITARAKYYVRLVATVGTIVPRDIDQMSDAVFGRRSDSGSVAAIGRFVLRSMLELSDYLQGVTVEAKGRKTAGAEILRR